MIEEFGQLFECNAWILSCAPKYNFERNFESLKSETVERSRVFEI